MLQLLAQKMFQQQSNLSGNHTVAVRECVQPFQCMAHVNAVTARVETC